MDLKAIYLTALEHCAPERLVRGCVRPDMPRNVVAIGKCAGGMVDGVAEVHPIENAFVVVPEGYPLPAVIRPVILSRVDGEGPPAEARDALNARGPSPSTR
ncbi:MAG TPA: hypothetical protein VF432_10520, partial [Thermoanaerobaculia bacterium]